MLRPGALRHNYPIDIGGGKISTTTTVWQILLASAVGDLSAVQSLVKAEPNLAYAQYNYMPPIHLAAREGHGKLVDFLLRCGAYDPSYRNYPFLDSLPEIAADRGHHYIAEKLSGFDEQSQQFSGDNGKIHYPRTAAENAFEEAVDKEDLATVAEILKAQPAFAEDEKFFWGEGILAMPAKEAAFHLIDLLMQHGATVPSILKWTPEYYFKKYEGAAYMMKKGMSAYTMSIHHVTILHNMAQKGFIDKAGLLINYGADINAVDEEYQSTPLALAARWGQFEMVKFLLGKGADVNKSGAAWSAPLAWAKKKNHEEIAEELIAAGATE